MSFNKKILALVIAGMLPGAAFAGVTLAPGEGQSGTGTPIFAEETAIPGSNLQNGTAPHDAIINVTTQLGFSIVGSSKYIRFDFPGTTLAAPITSDNFSTSPLSGSLTISAMGPNYVVVELSGANLSNTNFFNFDVDLVPITPDAKAGHQITYRLYETASQAANNVTGSALATASGTWYTFGKALKVECLPLTSKKINVTQREEFIDGSSDSDLFSLTAKISGTNVFTNVGEPVLTTNYLPNGTTFTATGNVQNILGAGNLFLNGTPSVATATTATWTTPSPALDYDAEVVDLTTDGVNELVAGDYSVVVHPGPGALNPADIDLGVCGSLAYSGSSDRVDFSLTPNSTNKQYLRITNPTTFGGAVTVTMWNDAGDEVSFPLSDIVIGATPVPGILDPKASTQLIDVNDFFKAAQAKDNTFDVVGASKKLRIEVRGAFGDDHLDGHFWTGGKASTSRLQDGIYIQSIMSGSSFNQSH